MFKRLLHLFFLLFSIPLFSAEPQELSDDWTQTFHVQDLILNEHSRHQNIVIFKNRTLGKILMLDDIVQLTDKDEFIYHEMLAHVPLFTHPKPKTVLIIGGGDGAVLREVLKHPSVDLITVIELDGKIVDICQKHFPHLAQNAFEDSRVRLLIDDGFRYLKKGTSTYDIIIVNTPDPFGPAKSLFKRKFYELCNQRLNDNGILACQNGCPLVQLPEIQDSIKFKEEIFASSSFYFSPAPSQLSGVKTFSISFKGNINPNPSFKELTKRCSHIRGELRYYTPEVHIASFCIPKYLQNDVQ